MGTCNVKGGGNAFLCTEKEYGDFILELDIKSDNGLNSGVQIRSHCFDKATEYDFWRQDDQDSVGSRSRLSGGGGSSGEATLERGIYDEARRGWLNPLATNSPAGLAFEIGEWNKYRIECRGASIKTWVNDIPAADLVDAESLRVSSACRFILLTSRSIRCASAMCGCRTWANVSGTRRGIASSVRGN